jgi:hypothetical protein
MGRRTSVIASSSCIPRGIGHPPPSTTMMATGRTAPSATCDRQQLDRTMPIGPGRARRASRAVAGKTRRLADGKFTSKQTRSASASDGSMSVKSRPELTSTRRNFCMASLAWLSVPDRLWKVRHDRPQDPNRAPRRSNDRAGERHSTCGQRRAPLAGQAHNRNGVIPLGGPKAEAGCSGLKSQRLGQSASLCGLARGAFQRRLTPGGQPRPFNAGGTPGQRRCYSAARVRYSGANGTTNLIVAQGH